MEQQRDPSLRNRAVAIQQHGDIIAMNTAAKAAGVRKHCPPDQARKLLREVGGKVAHVFVEEGYRISYRPYREMSALFHKLLRAMVDVQAWQGVIEKASIDEAFILLPSQHGTTAHMVAASLRIPHRFKPALQCTPLTPQLASSG